MVFLIFKVDVKPCFVGLWASNIEPSSRPTTFAGLESLASAADAVGYIYPLLVLLAASRWQSAWWLIPALAVALVQFSLLTRIDAIYCFALARYGDLTPIYATNDDNAQPVDAALGDLLTARIIVVFRLLQWVTALLASLILAVLVLVHILLPSLRARQLMTLAGANAATSSFHGPSAGARAAAAAADGDSYAQLSTNGAATAAPSRGCCFCGGPGAGYGHRDMRPFVPDSVIVYSRMRDYERAHSAESSPCGAASWLFIRLQLVPLRHWLAVALAVLGLALLQLLVASAFVGAFGEVEPASLVGTLLSCALISQTLVSLFGALAISISLWAVSGDVTRLLEAHRRVWDVEGRAAEALPFAKGGDLAGESGGPLDAAATDNYVSTPPLFLQHVGVCSKRILTACGGGYGLVLGNPAPPRVLDLSVFSFTDAPVYLIMFATSLLTVCQIAGVIFTGILFFCTYAPLQEYLYIYCGTLVGGIIARFLFFRIVRCCCAARNALFMPRWFLYIDAAYSVGVSSLFSPTVGVTRVALAMLSALLAATQLSAPTLPASVALLDGGFASYGAMLKLHLAWAIDPENAPLPGHISGA